jgi:hypothetical protein
MTSLFCRHNRFTAECPICSKGSVLARPPAERRVAPPAKGTSSKRGSARAGAPARTFQGPYVSAGPYNREARVYDVRLEKVPGGLRLAEWRGGGLERHAPVLPASALRELVDEARSRGIVGFDLPGAEGGDGGRAASAGTAGDMREELRIERADEPGTVRVARFVYWPGDDLWELQESPVMLPEKRFEEAFTAAARLGLI